MSRNQRGFEVFSLIVVILVLAIIGFAGYKIYQRESADKSSALPQIQTKSDLNKASDTLDSTPIDESLDPNQLDSDIESLL